MDAALDRLVQQGLPLSDLIVVEYRAEPIHGDVFRKLSIYRIGDHLITATSVHERHRTAKYGEDGVAGAAAYDEDLERMRTRPFDETLMRVFEAANIDYGRADFGLVAGRPEIYEINTNPSIGRPLVKHPFPARLEADRLARARYDAALDAIDDNAAGDPVRIPCAAPLRERPRRWRLFPGYQWVP